MWELSVRLADGEIVKAQINARTKEDCEEKGLEKMRKANFLSPGWKVINIKNIDKD